MKSKHFLHQILTYLCLVEILPVSPGGPELAVANLDDVGPLPVFVHGRAGGLAPGVGGDVVLVALVLVACSTEENKGRPL